MQMTIITVKKTDKNLLFQSNSYKISLFWAFPCSKLAPQIHFEVLCSFHVVCNPEIWPVQIQFCTYWASDTIWPFSLSQRSFAKFPYVWANFTLL